MRGPKSGDIAEGTGNPFQLHAVLRERAARCASGGPCPDQGPVRKGQGTLRVHGGGAVSGEDPRRWSSPPKPRKERVRVPRRALSQKAQGFIETNADERRPHHS